MNTSKLDLLSILFSITIACNEGGAGVLSPPYITDTNTASITTTSTSSVVAAIPDAGGVDSLVINADTRTIQGDAKVPDTSVPDAQAPTPDTTPDTLTTDTVVADVVTVDTTLDLTPDTLTTDTIIADVVTVDTIPDLTPDITPPDAQNCVQPRPNLGHLVLFTLYAKGLGGIQSVGDTIINGSIGDWSSNPPIGFPPGIINGSRTARTSPTDPKFLPVDASWRALYLDITSRTNCMVTLDAEIGGQTLGPGLYQNTDELFPGGDLPRIATTISTENLTLDGKGDPNAVFIFNLRGPLDLQNSKSIVLKGKAKVENIFWYVLGPITAGKGSWIMGNFITTQAITFEHGTGLIGRASANRFYLDATKVWETCFPGWSMCSN